jgi:hypothetical protein
VLIGPVAMARGPHYEAADEALVVLIDESMNGPYERCLAAKFLLDCLRRGFTKAEIAARLDRLEAQALLDVASEARSLAMGWGLVDQNTDPLNERE